MLCAPQVTDKRLPSLMQCNGLVRDTDNRFSEGQLVRGPVYVLPENRDTKFPVFPLGHCSDWKLARYSSSIQEVNRASYLTSEAAATEGFELLSPQPTIVYWLDRPNEKNMQDQDIPIKPLPNGGNTLGQHRHRKKVKNSLTTCPTCHVVASTSSALITAPLLSDSDILNDDGKPPKRSSRKKRNKFKQCRRGTGENLNLLPEILREEQIDTASPAEVLLPDLLADKLSDTSSSASSLVKDTHLGKDNAESNVGYVEHGTVLTLSTLLSDEKDGPGCTGSSNITVGERVSCKGAAYLNDGINTVDSSEFGGSAITEHVYSYLGEESNSCQKSSCACVCNSTGATANSFFKVRNSDNCGDCSIDFDGRLTSKDENKRDGLQHGASTGLHLSGTHAEDVTDISSHTGRVQCSSEACSSKMFLPVSSGRTGRRSKKPSSYNNLTATNRVVGSNRHSGKDNPVSVWQKVEKLNKEKSSVAGQVVVSAFEDKSALEDTNKGVQHDPNRPMDKHRCKKSCKQRSLNVAVDMGVSTENGAANSCRKSSRCVYKKQTPYLYEQSSLSCKIGSYQSSRNYYAPKNGIPKMPKNHSQQIEGLPMLQLVCARDINDRPIATGIEKATLAPQNLDSHLVPQPTSKEACTLAIQDDAHSTCLENKAISSSNLCADARAAEMEEIQCVKSYSTAVHMPHKWVPIVKKDIIHFDVPEASVVEASVPADVSVSANIDVQRNVSDVPASTKCEGREVAKLNSSRQLDSKCQVHIENGAAFSKITGAVSDAYRVQQRVEDIQLLTGRPLADFEQFIYLASPILHCSSCPTGCNSSSQEWVRDCLCFHHSLDIPLSSIWQWYEEPGCYGLEVKAHDLRRSKGFWNSHYQFNAYFVPYLSAVQLFGQSKRTIGKDAADTGARSKTSPCMSSLPILAKLLPKESSQRNSPSALHIKDDQQLETIEPIFEFFESEQPFWRRQLFDKVKELIHGAKQSNCQISGDPKSLELNLLDLHPASWYCVAWYPIYRIPDGKLQAAFLTYHSLGHWVHRRSSSDQAGHSHVVLPVMGLQSYNDKGEWWFQTSMSGLEDVDSTDSLGSQVSQVLRERVSTLKQAAAAMARADVPKKDQTCRNRHPDYEFFLSRSR